MNSVGPKQKVGQTLKIIWLTDLKFKGDTGNAILIFLLLLVNVHSRERRALGEKKKPALNFHLLLFILPLSISIPLQLGPLEGLQITL